jgi:hypothetical protein
MMLEQQRVEFVHLVQHLHATFRRGDLSGSGAASRMRAEPEANEVCELRIGWMISLAC